MSATGIIIANDYPGSDLGAQINNADAALGVSAGVIVVLPGDYVISTQVVLSDNHHLVLGTGSYDNTMTDSCVFLMKDNTEISAANKWGAQVYETANRAGGATTAIFDYLSSIDNSDPGNSNLAVRGIKFLAKAVEADGVSGTIEFGNVHNATVEDCCWEGTSGFCVVFGGHSNLGNYAKNIRVLNNTMLEAGTQNIAAVNFSDLIIHGNTMIAGGAGGRDKSTFIDLELNTGTDIGQSFVVSDNVIDARGGNPAGPGTGISVVGGTRGAVVDGLVKGNVIIGGGLDQAQQPVLAGGIRVLLADNVEIVDNVIDYIGQVGIALDASNNCSVKSNRVTNAGPVGVIPQTITLVGAQQCTVSNNELGTERSSSYWAGIYEDPSESYSQTCDYNLIFDNRLYFSPQQSISNPDHELKITLSGPNSREWDNYVGKQVVGGPPGVDTMSDLTASYIPGDHSGTVAALALVLGQITRGDIQPALYAYNAAATGTADGVTLIKNTNNSGNGRYELSSQWVKLNGAGESALTGQQPGFTYFNTSSSKLRTWDGSAWHDLW